MVKPSKALVEYARATLENPQRKVVEGRIMMDIMEIFRHADNEKREELARIIDSIELFMRELTKIVDSDRNVNEDIQ